MIPIVFILIGIVIVLLIGFFIILYVSFKKQILLFAPYTPIQLDNSFQPFHPIIQLTPEQIAERKRIAGFAA